MSDYERDDEHDADGEECGDELIGEDWPTYSTPIPVWVLLAGLSPRAFKMYAFLAEHINAKIRDPRKRIACPKQTAIALVLGLQDDRGVARYRKELEKAGAIRVVQYRYAGGMRRGYRYYVRYNPPAGYTGHMVLGQFYDAHPEVGSAARWEGRTAAAKKVGETATIPAQAAPPAPGSKPSAKPAAARKKEKKPAVTLAPEILQVLQAFAPELRAAMRETAHTDAPKTLVTTIEKQLRGRTAEQLVDRVSRRWHSHGYARKFEAGKLERPVGAAVAMLRHGECPDPECEDSELIGTGAACRLCIERNKNYKADHAAQRRPEREAAAATAAARRCPGCERDRGSDGAVCGECTADLERAIVAAADRAAADIAAMPEPPAGWTDARARVLAEAERLRAGVEEIGLGDAHGGISPLLAAHQAAESAAIEARRLRLAALDVPASPGPALANTAPLERVPCTGSRWDGSDCKRLTDAEDGLCGVCRGAELAQHLDLTAAR
ncbi:hypothetical protein BX261_7278 [Streptomyces sp. 2321.6]|uniref:hypothetical protein n=1 Tax=Streptomyces sp. 2321.6 TaxID=1938840 RepID=UPI000BB12C61|nr:hypothetical protein [Streptomyces sp. 2321.6]PBC72404.1 hypothetical protein BX261_7278 [Streptomyces sp. 2321.6]